MLVAAAAASVTGDWSSVTSSMDNHDGDQQQQQQHQDSYYYDAAASDLPEKSSLAATMTLPHADMMYSGLFQQQPPAWDFHRGLAGGGSSEAGRIDYSVLSVAVMTLGLIMVVEVIRHKLDQAALGRPFFKAVLEGVYAELATLGIVEFFIWLLHSYYSGLDLAKEEVFARVHFTLFYTAILNAFQSVLLAYVTIKVSQRIWVQTETLELNHYVEIREEFVAVQRELQGLHHMDHFGEPPHKQRHNHVNGGSSSSGDEQQKQKSQNGSGGGGSGGGGHGSGDVPDAFSHRKRSDVEQEFVFELSCKSLRNIWRGLVDRWRYPRLNARYHQLLTQVRFHELRVHLLQAYELPLKLKISHYLCRSEQAVLIRLVHVSMIAWLLLTACVNVLYFVLGIVATETQDGELVGMSLTWMFFWIMAIFIAVSFVVYNKMRCIFQVIMHQKVLWDLPEAEDEKEHLAQQQLNLFWGGDPKYVIAAIQFMQFGYAVALSVIIIFWDVLSDGSLSNGWYFLAIVGCYAVFVMVTAHVIPRYTLCTSLGQLVDRKLLQETVAQFHLQEAKRQRIEEQEQIAAELQYALAVPEKSDSHGWSKGARRRVRNRIKSLSDGVKRMAGGGGGDATSSTVTVMDNGSEHSNWNKPTPHSLDSALLMAELVKLDTEALRTRLPDAERQRLSLRDQEREKRRQRRKSRSEGVGAMAAMSLRPSNTSQDDSMLLSRRSSHDQNGFKASLVPGMSSELTVGERGLLTTRSARLDLDDSRRLREEHRQRRRKSYSDGVAAMAYSHRFGRNERCHFADSSPSDVIVSDAASTTDPLEAITEGSPANAQLPLEHGCENATYAVEARENRTKDGDDRWSTRSEHSDADDVPDVDLEWLDPEHFDTRPQRSVIQWLRMFYVSRRYVVVSNVFGTMIAFFFVGQRVERFLHTEQIVSDEFVSFDFHEAYTFWLLFLWVAFFLVADCLIFAALGRFRSLESNRERKVVVGALLDFFLVSFCLAMLIIAEVERCCVAGDSANDWGLASSESSNTGHATYDNFDDAERAPCECPAFGHRLYGGLGKIEPFVSLIALRLFRHWIAKKIVENFDSRRQWSHSHSHHFSQRPDPTQENPFDVFGKPKHDSHHRKDETGTIVELWETAVGRHPQIVAKYGEFSGEMLQVMLGVSPRPSSASMSTVQAAMDGTKRELPRLPVQVETTLDSKQAESDATERPTITRGTSFAVVQEYSDLSAHAQEIIMAGRVGRPVKFVEGPIAAGTTGDESTNEEQSPHFEIDHEATVAPEFDSVVSAPNARLLRSLRRCDRKLLPILGTWTVVDVAITKYEMVYFDAQDVDNEDTDEEVRDTKQAIKATKGGKGLRLCDVAIGRKVAGHLLFADVVSALVEREMPDDRRKADDGPEIEVHQCEYWQKKSDKARLAKGSDWRNIKEDRLRVETVHNRVLYLRFYSDLDDANHHPDRCRNENEDDGPLFKNNALQWAQTICRICGPDQLKQALPHFGDDTSEELRDYLVVHHYHEGDHTNRGLRRGLSGFDGRRSFHMGGSTRYRRSVLGTGAHRASSAVSDHENEDNNPPSSTRSTGYRGGLSNRFSSLCRRASSMHATYNDENRHSTGHVNVDREEGTANDGSVITMQDDPMRSAPIRQYHRRATFDENLLSTDPGEDKV